MKQPFYQSYGGRPQPGFSYQAPNLPGTTASGEESELGKYLRRLLSGSQGEFPNAAMSGPLLDPEMEGIARGHLRNAMGTQADPFGGLEAPAISAAMRQAGVGLSGTGAAGAAGAAGAGSAAGGAGVAGLLASL